MSNKPLFLVKIGKKEHLERLTEGRLYCSPSEKYIKQEQEQHEKGQGDLLEGKMKIKVAGGYWEDDVTHLRVNLQEGSIVTLQIQDVNNMPIFCMTKGTKEDCSFYTSDREYEIKFPISFENEVRNSFKNADAALLIYEPEKFINSMLDTINQTVVYDDIQYFDYDLMDINMMYFLTGVDKFENNKPYGMIYDNRYRHLLCKDIAFEEQREYRLILLDDKIIEPKEYEFKFETTYEIVDLQQLFDGIKVKY